MSLPGQRVLRAIDDALATRQHHPTLFAAQLRNDRDCRQLARAVARYKREKPAAGGRVERDEVERVDAGWEEANAREREEHVRGRRLRLNSHERDRRMGTTGLMLAHEVRLEMAAISTVPAGSVERSRGGESVGAVPYQQRLRDDPRWRLAERIVHRQALVLFDLIDEARGLSQSAAVSALGEIEKDRAIREEGVGLTAEETFRMLGPEYGSVSLIRRKRRNDWDLDSRGYPREKDS